MFHRVAAKLAGIVADLKKRLKEAAMRDDATVKDCAAEKTPSASGSTLRASAPQAHSHTLDVNASAGDGTQRIVSGDFHEANVAREAAPAASISPPFGVPGCQCRRPEPGPESGRQIQSRG